VVLWPKYWYTRVNVRVPNIFINNTLILLAPYNPPPYKKKKAALVGVVNVGLWPYYWYKIVDAYLPNQAPLDLTVAV